VDRLIERRTDAANDAAQLPALMRFLQEFWSAAELPPADSPSFLLALEEVFMNVVLHGTPRGTQSRVGVSIRLRGSELTMTIEDDGPPFDPLSLASPDVHARIEQRQIGGLGVYLVRQVMDAVSYQRVGNQNRLTLSKRLTP
jgi:serine/threonine-protein kinase RsbW